MTGTKHKRTRPYTPRTNRKVERLNGTLAHEWAYVRGSSSEATSSPDGRHTMVFNANGDWAHIEAVKALEAEHCGTPPPAQR